MFLSPFLYLPGKTAALVEAKLTYKVTHLSTDEKNIHNTTHFLVSMHGNDHKLQIDSQKKQNCQ